MMNQDTLNQDIGHILTAYTQDTKWGHLFRGHAVEAGKEGGEMEKKADSASLKLLQGRGG